MARLSKWLLSLLESEEETALAEAQIASGASARTEVAAQARSYEAYAAEQLASGNDRPMRAVLAMIGRR